MSTHNDVGVKAAKTLWRSIPRSTLKQAVEYGYGPSGNLAVRKALGIRFPGPSVVHVGLAGNVTVVNSSHSRCVVWAAQFRDIGYQTDVFRNRDRKWVLSAVKP